MSALALAEPEQLASFAQLALLLALRLVPLILLLPVFLAGLFAVPLLARVTLLLVLTLCLLPAAHAHAAALPVSGATLVPLALRELAVGLVYGFALALPLHAARWAGDLMEAVRDFEPPREGALGRFYLLLAIAVYVAIGGHRLLLRALADTLAASPLGAAASQSNEASLATLALGSAGLLAHALMTALLLSAPVLLVMVLTDVLAGIVARATRAPPILGLQGALRPLWLVLLAWFSMGFLVVGLEQVFSNSFQDFRAFFR